MFVHLFFQIDIVKLIVFIPQIIFLAKIPIRIMYIFVNMYKYIERIVEFK